MIDRMTRVILFGFACAFLGWSVLFIGLIGWVAFQINAFVYVFEAGLGLFATTLIISALSAATVAFVKALKP